MTEQQEFQKRMKRIESLIEGIQSAADPVLRGRAVELVELLMELHGTALERMLTTVAEAGPQGLALIDQCAADPLVASLMLLYGLHPEDLETRVGRALEKVRPYLKSHGGNVELLAIEEGAVRLRLEESCHGCPSSAMTLKLAIEEALHEFAPDATDIAVEGVVPERAETAFMPLSKVQPLDTSATMPHSNPVQTEEAAATVAGGWEDVDGLLSLGEGAVRTLEIAGLSVLCCRVGPEWYAYRNQCPACGQPLDGAALDGTSLGCPACGDRYDGVRAGRGLDRPDLHLEPLPLLVQGGRAKIAMPAMPALS